MRPYIVLPDRSSLVEYKYPGIPILTLDTHLALSGYEALCHWHTDLEFFYIYHGSMDFFINGKVVHVRKGEGVFINSRRLHYSFSKEKNDCSYYIVLIDFSTLLQRSSIVDLYIKKKFDWNTADYIVLHSDVPLEQRIITSIQEIHKAMNEDEINPYRIFALGCDICASIGEQIPNLDEDNTGSYEHTTFLNMTSFISSHYQELITLDDIAAAGAVCRSKCCHIFKQQVKQSPNNYLVQYRIAKSCELLRSSDMSIGEIAHLCGFHSSSYFTNVFKKHTECSPREYRISNIKE